MNDFNRRQLPGMSGHLQADIDEALQRQRADIDAASTYTPSTPGDWASPAPKTVAEALDRLAAVAGSPP